MGNSSEQLTHFSQLWDSEQKTLAERAAFVPDNGIIVEIGTAQGGSAAIFHAVTGRRGVRVYSFDLAPSAEAYERLSGTNVTIVAKPSMEGALEWTSTVGEPIDLLFLDGSHALQDIFEDFNSWVPYLKAGGEIIFHDYDSIERGGLAHLGVHVVLRTILRQEILEKPVHSDRLVYGTISNPDAARLETRECWETFIELARQIVHVRDADYTGRIVVGDGKFARLLSSCLKIDGRAMFLSPDKVIVPGNYLVLARPFTPTLDILRQRNIARDSILVIDNLQACYIIARALQEKRDQLVTAASSRNDFFRWEEILFMLEHALGPSQFPDGLRNCRAESDIGRLSRIVALEQVRLAFLSRILESLVGWKP